MKLISIKQQKIQQLIAIFGGFLHGAVFTIMAFGIFNPDFITIEVFTSDLIVFVFCSFSGLEDYPAITIGAGIFAGILTAIATKILFQKQRSALAWCIAAAGYGLLFFAMYLCWQIYLAMSGLGGYD